MTPASVLLRALVSITLAVASSATPAATLEVTVVDTEGAAVPDTAVMVRYTLTPANPPMPPRTAVIEQERLRFKPFLSIVPVGTTLSFVNRDAFDHHIRSTAPAGAKDFELRIGPAGSKPGEIKVDGLGRYALGCHLHSQMRGYVLVTETPWFGKTDAEGKLVLNDLPEGVAEVVLVHPEQFLDQPAQRITLGQSATQWHGQLNFTPRKRRS